MARLIIFTLALDNKYVCELEKKRLTIVGAESDEHAATEVEQNNLNKATAIFLLPKKRKGEKQS